MNHKRKLGTIHAPLQFERWCMAYLETSTQRKMYNAEDRRRWARNATQCIMRRFLIPTQPNGDTHE